jgi:DNA-binding transcriptional ArsR family regulator
MILSLMAQYSTDLFPVFRALADPTRLAVIEALAKGPKPVSALAEPFDMALPSFMKHIVILEAAGLVTTEKAGRQRFVRLNAARLKAAHDWFADRRALWTRRFQALEAHLQSLPEPEGQNPDANEKEENP